MTFLLCPNKKCSGRFLLPNAPLTGVPYRWGNSSRRFQKRVLIACYSSKEEGMPPHVHTAVRDFLNRKCPRVSISRRSPIAWPPRTPELTRRLYVFFRRYTARININNKDKYKECRIYIICPNCEKNA